MSAWAWVSLALVATALEVAALARGEDRLYPLTHYLRKLPDWRSPVFWIALGLWAWLPVHIWLDR